MYLNESTTAELLERAAQAAGSHPFLVADQGTLTYAQTVIEVDRVAAGLERFGIRRGDRVIVLMNSRLEYPLAVFALHVLGATAVNVNPAYSPEELEYVCAQSGAKALIADAEFAANVRAARLQQPVVWIGAAAASDGDIAWHALRRDGGEVNLRRPGVTPDDPATVIYTSGTTSRPKGVVFRQGSHGFAGEYLSRNLGVTPQDIYYCTFPLFHSNAISNGIFPILAVRGTIVLKKFSASAFIDDVLKYRATVTSGGAPHWRLVMQNAHKRGLRELPDSRLRVALSGLAMTDEEYETFERLFGCRIVEIYGQTEGVVPCTIHPPHGFPRKRRSGGPPGLGSEVRIVLPDGQLAQRGEVGEIQFRTHGDGGKTLGYLEQPEETAKIFTADGWIRSYDLGLLDADGWLQFVDRIKDMIKVGGENVAASEVERVLDEHPAIRESAVVAFPDPILSSVVGAYVVLRAGAQFDADAIIEYCKTRLAKFKVPTVIKRIDALPRNALGKVVKPALAGQ